VIIGQDKVSDLFAAGRQFDDIQQKQQVDFYLFDSIQGY